MDRRDFLKTTGGIAAGAALSVDSLRAASSQIRHVVVVMMENRSFDHFLGWLPNADGKQAGLSYVDQTGAIHYTHHLAGDFTGCGHVQPDHSYQGGRIQYDAEKMDGFLRSGNDTF